MRPKIRENSSRLIRHYRLRKKVVGTPERPRLCLSPSVNHLEAQIINDYDQKTLFGVSTKGAEFKEKSGLKSSGNVKAAEVFGKFFAERAKAKGFGKVVLDRSGFLYHGRVKAFAEAARAQGLSF